MFSSIQTVHVFTIIFLCLYDSILMKIVSYHRGTIALKNDTKHDRVCKSVTEIKGHAKNFPNAPRTRFVFVKFLKGCFQNVSYNNKHGN